MCPCLSCEAAFFNSVLINCAVFLVPALLNFNYSLQSYRAEGSYLENIGRSLSERAKGS